MTGFDRSRLFAEIAHDMRQTAYAMGLHLEPFLRADEAFEAAAMRQAAQNVQASWQLLDRLLAQVLEFAHVDSGALQIQLKPVDLHLIATSTARQLGALADRAGVRIIVLVRPGCHVEADETMLSRVLVNLLSNAIEVSPAGGVVVMALRRWQSGWCIQIRDSGIGIDMSMHKAVFDPFTQIEDAPIERRHQGHKKRGIGLGLAISKRLMQLMRGTIFVRSARQRGCCMTIWLPDIHATTLDQS